MSTHHGMKEFTGLHKLCHPTQMRSGHFGRMFPDLPPLYIAPGHLAAIGAKDGPMKSTGAAQKTVDMPVGHAFFGQFVDHDITLDLASSFARLDRAQETPNFRTPTLDLDCIYGDGPEGSPFMYWNIASGAGSEFSGIKLLTGADMSGASPEQQQDLARSMHGRGSSVIPEMMRTGSSPNYSLALSGSTTTWSTSCMPTAWKADTYSKKRAG